MIDPNKLQKINDKVKELLKEYKYLHSQGAPPFALDNIHTQITSLQWALDILLEK